MTRTRNTRSTGSSQFQPKVARYAKYDNQWCVRVPHASARTGDAVTVHKRDGTTRVEVLAARLETNYKYGDVYAIADVKDDTHAVVANALAENDRRDDTVIDEQRADDAIPSQLFTYDPNTRTFVAEASDLQEYAYGDVIRVRSAKTGNVATFDYRRRDLDSEGEVIAWEYACDDLGLRLHVLND
jgi:hypothetical protein